MTVQGGGIFKIETQGMGTVLEGETFVVESGGLIDVDKLKVVAHTLTIEDSAIISANAKVKFFFWFVLILYVPVYSYGHVGTVSSPKHTFFLGKLD